MTRCPYCGEPSGTGCLSWCARFRVLADRVSRLEGALREGSDRQPGPGDADCAACHKVWRHHHRGESGTTCATHNYGPACHPDLQPPGAKEVSK